MHFAEISTTDEGPYRLYELTSSALSAPSVGNETFINSYRISATYSEANYGLVAIDWQAQPAPLVTLKIVGLDGSSVFEHQVDMNELGGKRK